METLSKVFSPLSMGTSAVQDTVKLVVIGGTVETARRVSSSAWSSFIDSFFLTAHFSHDDVLMHWLSKQPAFGKSREFEITTRSVGKNSLDTTTGDLDEEEEDSEQFSHGRRKKKVVFMPCHDTTHTIYYGGHLLRVTRSKRNSDYGSTQELKISVVARSNDVIKRLVLEAKKLYEADAEHRIHIYLADHYGYWRYNGSRQKRPLSSIVLEPGVKDMIVADCKDFLRSEDWYAERGIPYRRGYLLYGVPGSGKTSLIHALAGELGLDIYVVSLSAKGMNDTMLMNLMGRIPQRCILLLEDLDAAFTRSVTRDSTSTGVPTTTKTTSSSLLTTTTENDGNSLSLSGLLNALDGVAASEGRLLFATTNHIDRLDEALRRPGRMDVWINFKHATKYQAEGIFKCFFPSSDTTPATTESESTDAPKNKRKHYASMPVLSAEELATLAKQFADKIPENELSVASLQGYLLKNKSRPRECVEEVTEWIRTERETRERLKKEKEEKEAKEKAEAELAKQKKESATAEGDEKESKKSSTKKSKSARIADTGKEETSTTTPTKAIEIVSEVKPTELVATSSVSAIDAIEKEDLVILSAITTSLPSSSNDTESSESGSSSDEEQTDTTTNKNEDSK
ncbi:hypothetical protein FRC19_000022 [Serendipita sp. 401]|nr:hypothetical protein FRC19_000022 [Serendipita sp. 401]